MSYQYQLAIIGGGAIGEALAAGAIKTGLYAPDRVLVSDPLVARRQYLANQYQVQTTTDNIQAAGQAAVLVMAVKPQVYLDVFKPMASEIAEDQLVISVAAGVTIKEIEAVLAGPVPVVRVMPNTPCLVGKGATVLARGTYALTQHIMTADRLFSALGFTVELPEDSLNAVTALSGSGPAYVYLIVEALIEAGVRIGLPRELSKQLILQTVAGSVQMMAETGKHPAELKEMVTSPGGTTAAALEYLEDQGIRGKIIKAVGQAWERAQELSRMKE
ncbi:MAG: pyrroline-5-carboxylate reductase [Clostridia bacterium]|nr:pyrroline-5-carboxylate reductase [Clostridia bacterium]